jgi:hypothetical protein
VHGVDHRPSLLLVVHDRVVQGAVRLDVAHPGPVHPAQGLQRPELVEHVVGQLSGADVEEAAAEPGEVAVAHLGPDHDPPGHREPAGVPQRGGVPGVEAAGHVRAGHAGQHGLVVAQGPVAEGLADVTVQVHTDGHRLPRLVSAE